jgi:diguanylate cyclase (GGDEF)-like protein
MPVLHEPPSPLPPTPSDAESWRDRLTRRLLRLGRARAVAVVSALVVVTAVTTTVLLVLLLGRGDPWLAAGVAGASTLLGAPFIIGTMVGLLFQLDATRQQLAVLATQDDLTGVHNRRHFMGLAEREWSRCRRYDIPAAVLLIDADRFKDINDRHGHLCGDQMLRELTRIAGASLRAGDLLARFGGEELIVFLPHTDPLGALDVAERIRERVCELRLAWQGREVQTTVSIGVASLGEHPALEALVHDADLALYAAKDAGRNCVRASPIQPRRSGESRTVAWR